MTSFLNNVFNFIFPESCIVCGLELRKHEKHICSACYPLLPRFEPQIYESHRRFLNNFKADNLHAMFLYSKSSCVQKIIHQIKYKDNKALAYLLGEEYAKKRCLNNFDFIIPVPLHSKRLNFRGYNQSMEWAKGISSKTNVPAKEMLIRVENTETQTKKSRWLRWQNVQTSFDLAADVSLQGKKVLLVDDVITTGATVESCTKILLEKGAKEVHVAAIGIAQ